MAKSFKGLLSKNQELKKESNLETENERLREKIRHLENNQDKDISLVKLSDIKLSSNIRQDDFNYNYEEIEILATDIEKNGHLQPVLISKDNYLLTGFRRYHAILYLSQNNRGADEILSYSYNKLHSDISDEELINIQLAENFQRREIDNFQLSKLYNELIFNGYNQQKLAEKFKKSKSFVSMVVSINKIDFELVKFLKQFQIFGWSEKKFNALNFLENTDEYYIKEFEKFKNLIGISSLNNIAKHENIQEQKKAFLKIFKNRLTDEEIKSDYFQDVLFKNEKTNEQKFDKLFKYTKALSNSIEKFDDLPKDTIKQLKSNINQIEKTLNKISLNLKL